MKFFPWQFFITTFCSSLLFSSAFAQSDESVLDENNDRGRCETLLNLLPDGDRQILTDKLARKRLWYHYAIGFTVEHHYIDNKTVRWVGAGDSAEEFSEAFTDEYFAFEIAPNIYFLNWCEAVSPSRFDTDAHKGAYPVALVLDLDRLVATVTFTEPGTDGDATYVIDQARIEIKD